MRARPVRCICTSAWTLVHYVQSLIKKEKGDEPASETGAAKTAAPEMTADNQNNG
jgi:hypothetical protein